MKSEHKALNDEQRVEYLKLRQRYNDVQKEEHSHCSTWQNNLVKSLTNIAKHNHGGISVEYLAHQQLDTAISPKLRIIERTLKVKFQLEQMYLPLEGDTSLIIMLARFPHSIKELSMLNYRERLQLSALAPLLTFTDPSAAHAFSALETLELSIVLRSNDSGNELSGLHCLLSNSFSLRRLRLHMTACVDPSNLWLLNGFANAILDSFMPSLEHADLNLFMPSDASITAFISRHHKSLKQLHLYEWESYRCGLASYPMAGNQHLLKADFEDLQLHIIAK